MKKFVLLFFILSSAGLYCQKWCAPGATWCYSFITPFEEIGYVTITYNGDSIINSITCNKLIKVFHSYNCESHTYQDYHIGNEYTYEDSGIVYILYKDVFDTLYNFNASIGNKWGFPKKTSNFYFCDTNSQFHVIDTGSIVINSNPLKYLVINSPEAHGYSDTIIEKIGLINGYMFPYDRCNGATDGNEGGPLRCYTDNNFPTYKPINYTMDCNYIQTGIDVKENLIIRISPNPFVDNFSISVNELNTDCYDVEILSLSGKLILHFKSLIGSQLFDLRSFKSGIYILRIKDQNHSLTRKLIKL